MPRIAPTVSVDAVGVGEQPVLTHANLTLRPWRADDADFLAAAYHDEAIRRWHARTMDAAEAAAWVTERQERWRARTAADWAVEIDRLRVGRVALRTINLEEARGEVAYWVAPLERGRGVAGRAVNALCAWAFEVAGLHRLDLHHSDRNEPSCRVAVKCGFAWEGTALSSLLHDDGWHDMHVHARINPAD